MSAANPSSLSGGAFAPAGRAKLFANLPLRVKLLLAFLVMSVLSSSAMVYFSRRTIRPDMIADVGQRLQEQTRSIALSAGNVVLRQIDLLRAFSVNDVVQEQVIRANDNYKPSTDIQGDILAIDKRWRTISDGDPFMQNLLTNAVAAQLQKYHKLFPDNVAMFVTDRYGAIVATTRRTSDYYQAEEQWWQTTWNNGQGAIYIGQPTFDESSKSLSIDIAMPLYDSNNQSAVGILQSTYRLDNLIDLVNSIRVGQTGRAQLLVTDKYVTADKKQASLDQDVVAQLFYAKDSYKEIIYQGVPTYMSQASMTTITNDPVIAQLGWSVILYQSSDEILQVVNAATQTTMLISLGALVLASLLALIVAQLLSRPIRRLTDAARLFAAGDLSHRLALRRRDEIGVLANGFDSMAEALETRIASEQEARTEAERLQLAEAEGRQRLEQAVGEYLAFTRQVAEGDLTRRIDSHYDGALGQLGAGLNSMVASLHDITAQVQDATSAIAAATAQILAATIEQAASSAEQSAAITETATSVEEVKVIAQQTAEKASQQAAGSQAALAIAQQGSQAIAGTVEGMTQVRTHVRAVAQVMQALTSHAQAISTTIATLSELADQISGLAQNAAIESTRAGKDGADLGELARLVRGLSERAKSATGEVRERLSAIQQGTYSAAQGSEQGSAGVEAGAALVLQAGEVIQRLAQEVEHGAQANVQMAAAAQQQMIGMEQIGQAMTAIQQATTQALAGTQQAEQAAQDLHTLALSLQQAIATYRL